MNYKHLEASLNTLEKSKHKREVQQKKGCHKRSIALENLLATERKYGDEKRHLFNEISKWRNGFLASPVSSRVYTLLNTNRLRIFEVQSYGHLTLESSKHSSSFIVLDKDGTLEYRGVEQVCGWKSIGPVIPLALETISQLRIVYLQEVYNAVKTGKVLDVLQSQIDREIRLYNSSYGVF